MTGAAQGLPHSAGIRIGTPAYRRVNLALFCAGFVTFVTLYDVQPLLPLFAREFNVVPAVASLPLSIATAALALGMLLAGTVSDSFGRRQLMTLALVLTSLLALATYFSHSFQSLLALRLVQGLVLAGVPSVAMAYLGEEMDAHSISSAMGLYISGNAVGGMTGRIGSAILCDHLPWQTAIAVIGIISLGLSLLFLRSLPPRPISTIVPSNSVICSARSTGSCAIRGCSACTGWPSCAWGLCLALQLHRFPAARCPLQPEPVQRQPDLSGLSAGVVQLRHRGQSDQPLRAPLHDQGYLTRHAGRNAGHPGIVPAADRVRRGYLYLRLL